MAILKDTNKIYYPKITDILRLFGVQLQSWARGYYDFNKEKRAVFFHHPVHHAKGGYYPAGNNDNWLNIPDKNWQAFTQIQLYKEKTDDAYADIFKTREYDKKEQAVFMLEKGSGYRFCGVYKALIVNKKAGICLYHRVSKTLNTSQWTQQ